MTPGRRGTAKPPKRASPRPRATRAVLTPKRRVSPESRGERPVTVPSDRRTIGIIALGLFCTTFGQPSVAGGYPIRYFLKDHLGLNASAVSTFFLVATLFWYLKPFAGLLSDSFPLFGSRRKIYLILSAALSGASWLAIGLLARHYAVFLALTVLLNFALVIGSTVSGGLLVEEAQKIGATGRLAALRQILSNLALLIAGPAGIWAYDHAGFHRTAAAIGAIFVPLGILAFLWLEDPRVALPRGEALARTRSELRLLLKNRLLLATAGMWALVVMAPGFGTLLVFRQTDVLHFPHAFVSRIAFVSGAGGIAASFLYGIACRHLNLRVLLPLSIVLTSCGALLYLRYDLRTALWIDGINGALSVLSLLPLFDMAARTTPRTAAALGYALLMSVNNIVLQLADKLGSMLYVTYHWHFQDLVWLNAATSAAALLAVPFLPRALLEPRDR